MDFKKRKEMNIAVIGSGISGIVASYLLQNRHHVTLYEKENYIGGHTHTILIPEGPDKGTPVDTGFIVLNERTYPNFLNFLSQLGVDTLPTEMSFAYFCEKTGLTYASNGINALFAQRRNLLKPRYLRFVYEMITYLKTLRKEYLSKTLPDITLSEYVNQKGLHNEVVDQFVVPMAAAIWSGSDFQIARFPIQTFAQFYENHGLLGITGHPPWFVVKQGSHAYVKAFLRSFRGQTIKNFAVQSITRADNNVTLHFENQSSKVYDAVVLATHADQALNLLDDPSDQEKKLLGVWQYSNNHTVLHTDSSIMPPNKRSWASWNYTRHAHASRDSPVTVTYDMNRLQRLDTHANYFVTLNPQQPIPAHHIIKKINYTHPQYSFEAFNSQKDLPALNGVKNTFFCGAYFGYGFHEDGVRAGLAVGEMFGETL